MIPEPWASRKEGVCGTGSGKEGFSGRETVVIEFYRLREFGCHLMGTAMGLGRMERSKKE